MADPTQAQQRIVDDVASRHGVSADATLALLRALIAGGGRMAQFSHPDLGGMGQWAEGGMVMVGRLFDQPLKQRVDGLCRDLAALLRTEPALTAALPPAAMGRARAQDAWWPEALGQPASAGGQNGVRYACFPEARRVAVDDGGTVTLYDSGDHRINGVSQQQGDGTRALVFTTRHGTLRVGDLPVAGRLGREPDVAPKPRDEAGDQTPDEPAISPRSSGVDDPVTVIERLSVLWKRGILTDEEFTTKKRVLLERL